MSTKFNFELTEVGQNGLWRAQNNGIDFELTHIEFGSSGEQKDSQYDAVKLSKAEQYSPIASGNRISETQIRIYAKVIPTHAFEIREIGLWQGEPNKEGSILFAYVAQDALFGQMIVGLDLIFSYDMIFTTADINSITIIEDSDTSLVLSLIGQHETNYDAHPYYVHKEKDNIIKGSNTFEKPIVGDLQGNADTANTADKLAKPVKIQGVDFDGSKDIDLPIFSENNNGLVPKRVGVTSNQFLCEDGTWKVLDLGEVGNADTALTLKNPQNFSITGMATSEPVLFNGSENVELEVLELDALGISGIIQTGNLSGEYNIDITGRAYNANRLTNPRSFSTNLGSNYASVFDGSANNSHGVTGVLPVHNGGTGQTTIEGIRNSLNVYSKDEVNTIQSNGIGVGQNWITYSKTDRKVSTHYHNSTGKPIEVAVLGDNYEQFFYVSRDAINWIPVFNIGRSGRFIAGATVIVPYGYYYMLQGGSFQAWSELR